MTVMTVEKNGLLATIQYDQDAESPRKWDNASTFVCWHRRYNLGDRHSFEIDEFQDYMESNSNGIYIPLYLYDHSGITISSSPFSCSWDSGQVGYAYMSRESIDKEFSGDYEKARKCIEDEIETYDQYLTGDVYGYTITNSEGDFVDSCWGFFGLNDCEAEVNSMLDYYGSIVGK